MVEIFLHQKMWPYHSAKQWNNREKKPETSIQCSRSFSNVREHRLTAIYRRHRLPLALFHIERASSADLCSKRSVVYSQRNKANEVELFVETLFCTREVILNFH